MTSGQTPHDGNPWTQSDWQGQGWESNRDWDQGGQSWGQDQSWHGNGQNWQGQQPSWDSGGWQNQQGSPKKAGIPILLAMGSLALALIATTVFLATRHDDEPRPTPTSSQVSTTTSASSSTSPTPTSPSPTTTSPSPTQSSSGGPVPQDTGEYRKYDLNNLKAPSEISGWKRLGSTDSVAFVMYNKGVNSLVIMALPVGDSQAGAKDLGDPHIEEGFICGESEESQPDSPTFTCLANLSNGYLTAASAGPGTTANQVAKDLKAWLEAADED